MKEQFLLDPEIVFLNHGSFGACPRPVFNTYQRWQSRMEHQPVKFLGREMVSMMFQARTKLGEYLNCDPKDIVYFPNPTTAINMVVRSLGLKPGDEVLTTNHEYGAMERTWRFICEQEGAKYIQQTIPLPVTTHKDFLDLFWQGVTPQTKVIFLSHITSPTALVFPVGEICCRAGQAGITTIVDGAHAPGQIPVDLGDIGADIYTGACHKWMLSPKGSSFLYARKDIQEQLDPLVISWGYKSDPGFGSGSQFIDYHEWQGTRDLSPFLTVPAAIDFMEANQWDQVRAECHRLAIETIRRINALTGLPPICPEGEIWLGQMVAACLPEMDVQQFQKDLYDRFQIEVPVLRWNDQPLIRVSIQAYNTEADVETLMGGLIDLL